MKKNRKIRSLVEGKKEKDRRVIKMIARKFFGECRDKEEWIQKDVNNC